MIVWFASISFCGFGQFGAERAALSRMQKGKWKSAEESLRKGLRKDATRTELSFILSWYFLEAANPNANIDSAYRYAVRAENYFFSANVKEREQLAKFPIDSIILLRQHQRADSLAFEQTRKLNTEDAYNHFLHQHKAARETGAATELRDEAAFLEALKINTYSSFKNYLERYPQSGRLKEAKDRYEKLLYADKTRDGKLVSYQRFLIEFPESYWRDDAARNIFEISTADGSISSLRYYINHFPATRFRRKAIALIYHLLKDDERESEFFSDSLKQAQQRDKGYWVPFMQNGKFGFMDQYGEQTFAPVLDSMQNDYTCGNIHADFIQVEGGIVSRAGSWIIHEELDSVVDMGSGFLKITRDKCIDVVHKFGMQSGEQCYDDVKLIAKNFIAFKRGNKWGLLTLTGRILFQPHYDDITALDTLILFIKSGKKQVVTLHQIAISADHDLVSGLVFDDVRRFSNGNYLVRNGALEGVINNVPEFIIPLGRYSITQSPEGFILSENNQFWISGASSAISIERYDEIQFYGNWAALRQGKKTQLYNRAKQKIEVVSDSLWFQYKLVFARHRDTLTVYLNPSAAIDFSSDNKVTFIASADSSKFFFVSDKKKKTLVNATTGKKLFVFGGDGLEYLGYNSFLSVKGNKKGIISSDGKNLLPVEYNAIVTSQGPWLSLFKDGKFGLYNLQTRKLVKAEFNRNVTAFSPKLLVAYKNTGYGFIDLNSKAVSDFDFAEIRPWNDSSAMVKKNFQWMIYGLASHKIRLSDIKDYHLAVESLQENVAIIRKGNYYGVISNRRGEVIPANFTNITNVGSTDEPMFLSEKYVEEAGIHVVIYYNKNGKVLRKQALEDADFERLVCE